MSNNEKAKRKKKKVKDEDTKPKINHRPGELLLSRQKEAKPEYVRKTDHPTMGRPSGFKEEYCEDIITFMAKGKSYTQWLVKHGIASQTAKRWLQNYAQFRSARDRAIEANMAYWESIGERGTVGQIPKFQQATYRFMMKNRFPHVYKDVHHHESTTTVKFETFVNDAGQIESSKHDDAIEGEIVRDEERDD